MTSTARARSCLVLAVAIPLFLSARVSAGDIWVDAINGLDTNVGSEIRPLKTITKAMTLVGTGDVVHVESGTYDVANGETFPIVCNAEVSVVGTESAQASYPRIGGDVQDSSVEALFEVDASSADQGPISIRRLYFVGEDSTGKDAPSALFVHVSDGHQATRVGFAHNYVERSEMDDSGTTDRAAIVLTVGNGLSQVTVNDNTIEATARGAIEQDLGGDTGPGDDVAKPDMLIKDNTFLVQGADTAAFAIRAGGAGDKQMGETAGIVIRNNLIDSQAVVGAGGFTDGIVLAVEAEGDAQLTFNKSQIDIVGNEIRHCTNDAIAFLSTVDGDDANNHLSCHTVWRNHLHDNGGAGIHMTWDVTNSSTATAYLNINTQSNMIVDNGVGILQDGLHATESQGDLKCAGDTIAGNDTYGFEVNGSDTSGAATGLDNMIVYHNVLGGDQVGGTAAWDPSTVSNLTHNDWQGLGVTTDGNFDDDPDFVDRFNGDYHIDSDSPCIEAGDNAPNGVSIVGFDFEGDDRIIDGDGTSPDLIDCGADEYDP